MAKASDPSGAVDLDRAIEQSALVASYRWSAAVLADSYPATVVRFFGRVARHSFIYRWLTAEPDPDVIVIDLRETHTVGPVLALLDQFVGRLSPAWRTSAFKAVADRFVLLLERVSESRTGRLVRKAFEPPERNDDE